VPFSRICAAAAGLALAMTIVAVGISAANRSLSRQAASRQRLINQAVVWGEINVRLANSLAAVASRDNDARIRKLLEQHGITSRGGTEKTGAPAAATAKPK
jgi:hypothetical protein